MSNRTRVYIFIILQQIFLLSLLFGINHRLNSVQLDRPLDSNGEPMLLKLKVSYLLAIYVFSPFL